MSYKLIVTIVPHTFGEFITSTANNSGASGGTILMARGTAANGVLQLLGLGDTAKDITYSIVEEGIKQKVCESIKSACDSKKKHFGVLFTVDLGDFIKSGNAADFCKGEKVMENENNYQVINVIVNKGFSEDAMAAARKAGAGGGTIVSAKGTAKEGDAKFFGMKIVPEKEMLLILAPAEKKEGIVNAIKNLPCFAQAGSGIIFCNQAGDFTLLGKQN